MTRVDRYAGLTGRWESEADDMAPMGIDGLLNAVLEFESVLRDHVLDLKRLPPIRVNKHGSRTIDDERFVHRIETRGRVPLGFVGAVDQPLVEYEASDAIPEGCRRVAFCRCDVDRVAEVVHESVEFGDRFRGTDRVDVPGFEDPERGVADGFVAIDLSVRGVLLLVDEDPDRARVVGGPGVPHGRRGVIEVPGVDGGCREIATDRVEQDLVPSTRHRPFRVFLDRRTRGVLRSRIQERAPPDGDTDREHGGDRSHRPHRSSVRHRSILPDVSEATLLLGPRGFAKARRSR